MMKMKFFMLFLFFIPLISSGFVEPEYFEGDDDSEEIVQKIILNLTMSLSGLDYLTKENYPPAQQLVSFLRNDFSKAKNFVKEYNEMGRTPKWPVPEEGSFSLSSLPIRLWLMPFISHKNLQFGGMLSKDLELLTESLKLLDQLKQRHPIMEKELQSLFEDYVITEIITKLKTPIHPSPEQLTLKCQKEFAKSFVSINKK